MNDIDKLEKWIKHYNPKFKKIFNFNVMKLGVSYNIFDGEELLEGSIRQIRDNVDYISVVYQTISNFGNPCSPGLELMLKNLKSIGLVDELFLYMPNLNGGGHFNEIRKNQQALLKAQEIQNREDIELGNDERKFATIKVKNTDTTLDMNNVLENAYVNNMKDFMIDFILETIKNPVLH